jgi:hypothetical protein
MEAGKITILLVMMSRSTPPTWRANCRRNIGDGLARGTQASRLSGGGALDDYQDVKQNERKAKHTRFYPGSAAVRA